MRFFAATVILSLLAVSSALPQQVETNALSHPVVRRQVPVDSPSMKSGGVIVPFTGGGPNGKVKRTDTRQVKRQVPVDTAAMKQGGVIVPFTGGGPNGKKK